MLAVVMDLSIAARLYTEVNRTIELQDYKRNRAVLSFFIAERTKLPKLMEVVWDLFQYHHIKLSYEVSCQTWNKSYGSQ